MSSTSTSNEQDSRFVSRLTRDTLALIMAGGRGSRLMQMTLSRAKPAVPFGGKFRIIDFTLSNCINSGIRRVGVLTQYKSHSLIRHLQQGWGFLRGQFGEFIELLPAEQRGEAYDWYSGTADSVYQNLDFIRRHQPAYVLVLAGDHIYKMDYGPMLAQHARTGAQVTVGCIEVPAEEASGFGVMQVDAANRVVEFQEKPQAPHCLADKPGVALASMGIYVFDARFLLEQLSRDAGIRESSHDFGKDVVPSLIAGGKVYAYRFSDLNEPGRQGYWRDVGTIDSYWLANIELTYLVPELNLYDAQWPIWTLQEQVPPAKFVFEQGPAAGTAVESLVAGGCIVSGAQVRRSVLSVNVRIERGTQIEDSLLLPGARIGSNCEIRRAIIDEGCVIPDGSRIGCDLGIDKKQYYVSAGGVTLVTREMLDA
jgi:glucose-1-phosphate adenylyltransferase